MSLTPSPFDLRNDLAVQAARSLDAKIEAAIRAAFDDGKDFVRAVDLTLSPDNLMEPRTLLEPVVHTISYRAGPIDPTEETPARFIRYRRPQDWQVRRSLR